MSKRKSQTAITDYIDEGFVREALVNYLALLGWSTAPRRRSCRSRSSSRGSTSTHVQKGGAVFDRERLEWLNGQWIRRLTADELVERLRPFLEAERAAGRIDRMPTDEEIARPRAARPGAAADARRDRRARRVPVRRRRSRSIPRCSSPSAGTPRRRSAASRRRARRSPTSGGSASRPRSSSRRFAALAEERGWKAGDLFMAIRVAVTGRTATPPLFDTLVALATTGRWPGSIGRWPCSPPQTTTPATSSSAG